MNKKEIFNYINTTIDKSGSLKRESIFRKKFPEKYDEFKSTEFPEYISELPFKQKLWHFLNDVYIIPKCIICGNNVSFETKCGKWGYKKFCSGKCAMEDIDTKNRIKDVMISKYGVDSYSKTEEYKEKIKSTCIKKYGDDNYAKTEEYKDRIKETCLKKYGTFHYSQTDECKNKVKNTCLKKYGVNNYSQTDECKKKVKSSCLEKYGTEYYQQTQECKDKVRETCIDRYGVDNYSKTEECKDKIKETCIEKYGSSNYTTSDEYKSKLKEIQEKIKSSCLGRYGTEYYSQSEDYRNKLDDIKRNSIITSINKYGLEYYSQSETFKNQVKNTCLEKYGVNNYTKTEEFKIKNYNTKLANNSFHSSNVESYFEEYLIFLNIDYIKQYKSDLYPFACDFYIQSLDMYIEIQGTWTHGGHPFDENYQEDVDKVVIWKEKNTKYYDNAIYTWTELDVKKRNIARANNLNYLEIFSDKIESCIQQFEEYLKDLLFEWCLKNELPGNSKWCAEHPIWDCNVGNKLSPRQAWSSEEHLKKAINNIFYMIPKEEKFRKVHINEILKCTIKNNEIIKSTTKLLQLIQNRFTIAKIAPKVTAISGDTVKKILDNSDIDISNGVYVPMSGFGGIIEGVKMWANENNTNIEIETYDINQELCNWYGWTQKDMLSEKVKTDKVVICCPPFGKKYEHWKGTPRSMSDINFKDWYNLIKEYIEAPEYIIIGPEISNKKSSGLFIKTTGVMVWTDDML